MRWLLSAFIPKGHFISVQWLRSTVPHQNIRPEAVSSAPSHLWWVHRATFQDARVHSKAAKTAVVLDLEQTSPNNQRFYTCDYMLNFEPLLKDNTLKHVELVLQRTCTQPPPPFSSASSSLYFSPILKWGETSWSVLSACLTRWKRPRTVAADILLLHIFITVI